MLKFCAEKMASNENVENELSDYEDFDMLLGGGSTPYQGGMKPPVSGGDYSANVLDREESNNDQAPWGAR